MTMDISLEMILKKEERAIFNQKMQQKKRQIATFVTIVKMKFCFCHVIILVFAKNVLYNA